MEEDIFMRQPDGFVVKGKEDHVCRLNKALYGLKQAGMIWNKQLHQFLTDTLGFKRTLADPCIYVIREQNRIVILGINYALIRLIAPAIPRNDR